MKLTVGFDEERWGTITTTESGYSYSGDRVDILKRMVADYGEDLKLAGDELLVGMTRTPHGYVWMRLEE